MKNEARLQQIEIGLTIILVVSIFLTIPAGLKVLVDGVLFVGWAVVAYFSPIMYAKWSELVGTAKLNRCFLTIIPIIFAVDFTRGLWSLVG